MSIVLLLSACCTSCDGCENESGDVVKTRSDPSEDFTAFRTFSLSSDAPNPDGSVTPMPSEVASHLSVVDDAVRTQLVGLGLIEVSPGANPDLFVVSMASARDQRALSWDCVPGSWWGYWWGFAAWSSDPCAWLAPLYGEYQIGTVAIGLVDVDSQNVAFGGVLQGVLDGKGNPEARLDNDVERMFADYPAEQAGPAR